MTSASSGARPARIRAELKRLREERDRAPIERAAYAAEMNERYDALEQKLVAAGWPPSSPWWRAQVRRYFESGCRQVVFRVGRRGGKSSTFCRVAVVEVLWGRHDVPPGDTGYVAFISESKKEATERLETIKKILGLLGVPYRPNDGGLVLRQKNRGFRVYRASIAGVSGFTAICIFCDEVAKWRDADTLANPAKEVLASVRPTMATQPLAKIVLSSSPLGKLDAHAAAFDQGDSAFQFTAEAATWVANPTISESATHELEPDEGKRLREYGAIPMEGDEESLLAAVSLDRCTRKQGGWLPKEAGVYYVATMDPGFTRNAFTFGLTARRFVGDVIKRSVIGVREWRGSTVQPLNPKVILTQIAYVCREYGITSVYTDQYELFGLHAIGQDVVLEVDGKKVPYPLTIIVPEWSANEKYGAAESLEVLAASESVELPPDKQLRADLMAVRKKLTPNGFTIHVPQTPDGRHCDYWPTVLLGVAKAVQDPERVVNHAPGTLAAFKAEEDRLEAAIDAEMEREEDEARADGWV